MKPCQRGRQPFIVSGESAEAGRPSEGALDHPAPWQKDEALPGYRELYHDQTDSLPGSLFGRFFSGVTLIDKSHFHLLARGLLHLFEQVSHLRALLLVGRRDFQSQQMTKGIDRRMHFASLFALIAIVASAVATFLAWTAGSAHPG